MATTHYSLFSPPSPFTTKRTPYRLIVSSKTGQRKNYLRPKILKTLTKSHPPPQPILSPPSPSEEHDFSLEIADTHSEDYFADVEEDDKFEDLQLSQATSTEQNGVFDNVYSAAIFKYGGMCLVGAFVFQTVCSILIFGNSDSNLKDGDLEVSERGKSKFLFSEDQKLVMEKKIKEIKLMAREVRRIESEKKMKGDEDDDEDEDTEIDDESSVSSNNNSFIEKEIDARLLKLQNRINSNKDSLAALHSNTHGKSSGKNVSDGNDALVFKKKFKFKSPSTKAAKPPKGFSGTKDSRELDAKTRDYGSEVTDHAGAPLEGRGKLVDDEPGVNLNDGKNLEEKKETSNKKTKDGFETKSINNGNVFNV